LLLGVYIVVWGIYCCPFLWFSDWFWNCSRRCGICLFFISSPTCTIYHFELPGHQDFGTVLDDVVIFVFLFHHQHVRFNTVLPGHLAKIRSDWFWLVT